MSKQSLSSVKNAKANKQANILGVAAAELGDMLGNYVCEARIAGATVECMVKAKLDYMMLNGLTVDDSIDMLKAPNKNNPGELYCIMVEAMNAPLWAHAMIELDVESLTDEQRTKFGMAKGRRDKYMSKCRAYIRNRGTMPLDLHDNAYRNKAKDKAKQPAKSSDEKPAAQPVAANEPKQVSFVASNDEPIKPIGLAALRDFLASWVEFTNKEAERSAELESVLELSDDLLDAVKHAIVKVQGKAKKNK